MPILTIIIVLIIVGVLLSLINNYIPMAQPINHIKRSGSDCRLLYGYCKRLGLSADLALSH